MTDAGSPLGVSFWRQDIDWYVQQQNRTPSFLRQDQDWNQRLSLGNSGNPVHPAAGAPDIADQKIVNLIGARAALPLIDANGIPASGSATGTALDLLA
jgi:hypothetical protein